ncbi:SGNH/GDSL hydrolase family protein [Lactobacillus johnsonii]|uniref:SGNH/GDSL hydrolase family protein n=1 Tax=Lactobacillus johnsonii TaxID=33959 RepID=UPI003F51851F
MKKLILFGDSLLAGYIDGHATNIVTQGLQEKLPNFTIINNSVPGSTTEEAIDFYDLRIKPFNYDLVILALGTNDANLQFGLSAGRYAHNLQVLVDLIGVDKTILMGPSYTNWKIAKDQAWPKTLQFELVAEQCHIENNIPFLNLAKVMRKTGHPNDLLQKDGIHLNQEGNKLLIEKLAELVKEKETAAIS